MTTEVVEHVDPGWPDKVTGVTPNAVTVAPESTTDPETDKPTLDARELGVDYQKAGQVRQLLAERRNAVAYGNTGRRDGIDQTLKMMGFTGDPESAPLAPDELPVGRTAKGRQVTTDKPSAATTAPAVKPAAAPVAPAGVTTTSMSASTGAAPATPSAPSDGKS